MRLLLLSNSTNHGDSYLGHAVDTVASFLGPAMTFVPYALADHDGYTARVREALGSRLEVRGLHEASDPRAALVQAPSVFIGGGNTFRLLAALQSLGLVEVLRERVRSGMPYMGASAGTNVAGASIRTTNDMPIVQPASFDALGLVPFQINPHYLDADPASTHKGETREQRLTEFLEENDALVLGLREGTWLQVDGDAATIGGSPVAPAAQGPAIVFERNAPTREIDGDVSWLLHRRSHFDTHF